MTIGRGSEKPWDGNVFVKNNSRKAAEHWLKPRLKGEVWESEFYHYKNYYHFTTDQTGYVIRHTHCYDSLFHSIDSVNFNYNLSKERLTINYIDGAPDYPQIYLTKSEFCRYVYVSEFEYTYGHEVLTKLSGHAISKR